MTNPNPGVPSEQEMAELHDEFIRRLAAGERPSIESYRTRAGSRFSEFASLARFDETVFREGAHTPAWIPLARYSGSGGTYVLRSRLGQGGIGQVFLATQVAVQRDVALKVLNRRVDHARMAMARRFTRGGQSAATVEHPHAMVVHDVGELTIDAADVRPYIAMGLLAGPNLREVIDGEAEELQLAGATHTEARARSVAGLLEGPTEALAEYHRAGVIHRDIKPANLIFDADGRLVLTDFDLAKRLSVPGVTSGGERIGSAHYMSPEQWRSPALADARSDIYSMGVIIFECVAGRRLFEGKSADQIARVQLDADSEDAPRSMSRLPASIRGVVASCISRRPDRRYASATELAEALGAVRRGETAHLITDKITEGAGPGRGFLVALAFGTLAALSLLLPQMSRSKAATLTLFSRPPLAPLSIDGRLHGPVPTGGMEVDLAPGTYQLSSRLGTCDVWHRTVSVEAGQRLRISIDLLGCAPHDEEVLRCIREAYGVDERRPVSRMRTPDVLAGCRILWPRGDVRPRDALGFAIESDRAIQGHVRFLDESGSMLARQDFSLKSRLTRGGFEGLDLRKLVPGALYTLSAHSSRGIEAKSVVRIVPADLAALKLAEIQRGLDSNGRLSRLFETAVLDQHGLATATLNRAIGDDPSGGSRSMLALALNALHQLELRDSDLFVKLLNAHAQSEK